MRRAGQFLRWASASRHCHSSRIIASARGPKLAEPEAAPPPFVKFGGLDVRLPVLQFRRQPVRAVQGMDPFQQDFPERLQVNDILQGVFELAVGQRPPPPVRSRLALL